MDDHSVESEKIFALLDSDNKVLNCICVLGNDETLLAVLAQHWGATSWLDTKVYGATGIGGFFDGEKLLPPPYAVEQEE